MTAGRNHGFNRRARPGKYRLDGTVAPVAHPTLEAMIESRVLGPGAVTHALHAAADNDVVNCLRDHPSSPVSRARTPRHRDRDHRCSEWM